MKRFRPNGFLAFSLALVLSLLASAAHADAVLSDPGPGKRVIIDQMDRRVAVPVDIKRIVTFAIPMPLVIFAVDGSGDKIAGMHPRSKAALDKNMLGLMAPELKGSNAGFVLGKTMFKVNIEALLKIEPDVVFQWARMEDDIRMIEEAGIPVIALDIRTYADVIGWIRITGELLGKQKQAAALIDYHEKTLGLIRSRTEAIPETAKPTVLFLTRFDAGSISAVGPHRYYDFVVNTTGAVNAAKGLVGRGGKNVNMEQIMVWDPDIIYLGNTTDLQPEDLYTNNMTHDWNGLKAVKNRRVYKIPDAGFWWYPPCLESPLYLRWLAQIQHSKLFDDYSMLRELQDFYATFYHYRLEADTAAAILNGRTNLEADTPPPPKKASARR